MRSLKASPLPTLTAGRPKTVVRFRLPYLPALEVFLAGSFNDWHPRMFPMIEAEGGGWVKDLALPPGTHEYRFVADGVWLADPANPRLVPNPFGGANSVIEVLLPPATTTSIVRSTKPKRTAAP